MATDCEGITTRPIGDNLAFQPATPAAFAFTFTFVFCTCCTAGPVCAIGGVDSDVIPDVTLTGSAGWWPASSNVRPLGRGAPVSCVPPLAFLAKSPEWENG